MTTCNSRERPRITKGGYHQAGQLPEVASEPRSTSKTQRRMAHVY